MHYDQMILHTIYILELHILIYIELQTKQIQEQEEENSVSSIRISHKAKAKLAKVGARITLKDGKHHSMEEIIDLLIEQYEKDHKESSDK